MNNFFCHVTLFVNNGEQEFWVDKGARHWNWGEYYPFTKQEVQNGQRKTGSNKEPTQATGTGKNSALVGISSLSLYTNWNPEQATEAGTGDIV